MPGFETRLSNQSRLLIADNTSDRDSLAEKFWISLTEVVG